MSSKIAQPAQCLYSSADYVKAFNEADKIQKAVDMAKRGYVIRNLPQYIHAFTGLVERAIATNDIGDKTNPNMCTAQKKLVTRLQSLEKQVTPISLKAAIAPPSKQLIQALKVDEPTPEKKESKWPWTRVAKYSAAGTAALIASPQIWSLAQKVPGMAATIFKAAPTAVVKSAATFEKTTDIVNDFAHGTGYTVQAFQYFLSQLGLSPAPQGTPGEDGTDLLMQQIITQVIYSMSGAQSAVNALLSPFMKDGGNLGRLGLTAMVVCNHITPNCTDMLTSAVAESYHTVADQAHEHPILASGLGSAATFFGTRNREMIYRSVTGASASARPTIGYLLAIAFLGITIEQIAPGLIGNVTTKAIDYSKENPWTIGGAITTTLGMGIISRLALDVLGGTPPFLEVGFGLAAGATTLALGTAANAIKESYQDPQGVLSSAATATSDAIGSIPTSIGSFISYAKTATNNATESAGNVISAGAQFIEDNSGTTILPLIGAVGGGMLSYGSRSVTHLTKLAAEFGRSLVPGNGRNIRILRGGTGKLFGIIITATAVGTAAILSGGATLATIAAIPAVIAGGGALIMNSRTTPNEYCREAKSFTATQFSNATLAITEHPWINTPAPSAGVSLATGEAGAAGNLTNASCQNPDGYLGSSATAVADSFREPEGYGHRVVSVSYPYIPFIAAAGISGGLAVIGKAALSRIILQGAIVGLFAGMGVRVVRSYKDSQSVLEPSATAVADNSPKLEGQDHTITPIPNSPYPLFNLNPYPPFITAVALSAALWIKDKKAQSMLVLGGAGVGLGASMVIPRTIASYQNPDGYLGSMANYLSAFWNKTLKRSAPI